MTTKQEKKVEDNLILLFLVMLKYADDKEFNRLLSKYKTNRNNFKNEVNRMIVKYTKNGEFNITPRETNKEVRGLEKQLKTIGKELYESEKELSIYILSLVYSNTYKRTYDIIDKGEKLNLNNISKGLINKEILNFKIKDKTISDRNKINKTIFINRLINSVKKDMKSKQSIDVINKNIDKKFNQASFESRRIIETEISRAFNKAQNKVYRELGVKKVRYNSQLEKNTCIYCASLHSAVFDIDEAPDLPLHQFCACFYTPVLD